MKFLIDMPLSPNLARWLRTRGYDAVHASVIGLHRASDATILARASMEKRTVMTADLDYPRLLAVARASTPSVILFRGGNWSDSEIIERMSTILAGTSAVDIEQSILVVERDRLRRRRLPIS